MHATENPPNDNFKTDIKLQNSVTFKYVILLPVIAAMGRHTVRSYAIFSDISSLLPLVAQLS